MAPLLLLLSPLLLFVAAYVQWATVGRPALPQSPTLLPGATAEPHGFPPWLRVTHYVIYLGLVGVAVVAAINGLAYWAAWRRPRTVQHAAKAIITPVMRLFLDRPAPRAEFPPGTSRPFAGPMASCRPARNGNRWPPVASSNTGSRCTASSRSQPSYRFPTCGRIVNYSDAMASSHRREASNAAGVGHESGPGNVTIAGTSFGLGSGAGMARLKKRKISVTYRQPGRIPK
jgi:hypothetical protein